MNNEVAEINPTGQLGSFFKMMFGSHKGYVYCPTTEPENASECEHFFFKWPEQTDDLIEHILKLRSDKEIYFSPLLFKKPELTRDNVYGTKYLWAEFNGETPDIEKTKNFPTPSFKVRTSQPGHEYWFWQLEFFEKDMAKIEDFSKRVAHHLHADLTAWHYESVLRPPSTIHHRSASRTFMFEHLDVVHNREVFEEIHDAPKYLTEENFREIPPIQDIIAKYQWKMDDFHFFYKSEIEDPKKRFSALTRLAFIAAEMGMENPEMLAVLLNADKRWKHFSDRKFEQRKNRLIALINHVRTKKPVEAYRDTKAEYPVYNFLDFMATEFTVNWLMEPFIEEAGQTMVTGDSNVGKTRFTLRWAIHAALGWDYLGWKCPRPLKIGFWSLEMTHGPLKRFLELLTSDLSEDDKKLLGENFFPSPIGHSVHLDKPSQQPKAKRLIEATKADVVIIDSLGVAVQDDIENAKIVNNVLEFVNKDIRGDMGTSVAWIHHHRKHGTNKPTADDIFGSVYLRNQMSSIWTLRRVKQDTKKGDILEVSNPKQRLAELYPTFKIRSNTKTIGYSLLDDLGAKIAEIDLDPSIDNDTLKGFMNLD